jgi:hypothetical protein
MNSPRASYVPNREPVVGRKPSAQAYLVVRLPLKAGVLDLVSNPGDLRTTKGNGKRCPRADRAVGRTCLLPKVVGLVWS